MRPPHVIIVNFNSGAHLSACLESILEHGNDSAVTVIDNASTDGSERVAEQLGIRVSLHRNAGNRGFGRAVNQGLSLIGSNAETVLLLNPDCRLLPQALDALLAALSTKSTCAIAAPRVLNDDGTIQGNVRGDPTIATGLFGRTSLLRRMFPRSRLASQNVPIVDQPADSLNAPPEGKSGGLEYPEVDWVSGACMLCRIAALASVGGFDERFFLYWEDADLCRRLRSEGYTICYVPTATVVHAVGGSTQSARALAIREFHRSAFLYYATHVARGPGDRALARALLSARCWWKLLSARIARARKPRSSRNNDDGVHPADSDARHMDSLAQTDRV
jgi:N-acetylglucosaminyl-diphospho-decaprenol L-rhamnosyltransferase